MTERRIARARRRPPPAAPAEPAAQQEADDFQGAATPWILARRLRGRRADLSYWVIHTADCPLAPPRPVARWPVRCGAPEDPQSAFHEAGADLAATIYQNLRNEACGLCKPGTLLLEEREDLRGLWLERGGR